MRRWKWCCTPLLCLAASLAPAALSAQTGQAPGVAAAGALGITFEAKAVVVTGVSPHGQVVWLGVSREFPDGTPLVMRREGIAADADGSGTVRLALDGGVPERSVWVVVDLSTGASAAAPAPGYPRREITFSEAQEVYWGLNAAAGGVETIRDVRGLVDLLVVRPQAGAWGARVGDGGPDDEDPAPGKLATTLAHLHPVGASPSPPASFRAGDVVVAIDPNRLSFSVWHLGQAPGPREGAR